MLGQLYCLSGWLWTAVVSHYRFPPRSFDLHLYYLSETFSGERSTKTFVCRPENNDISMMFAASVLQP
ncbi:hypothetical protein QVD17_06731 [Tagetes erecta]|uniref:Uncharacterized protein n=1 Tax=Tagetes erecta TaxID=13708 RepID=A0AAD8PBI1_TARER|nr:hypothetical protein QVD17_06731 [Tagetes erecta]